MTARKAIGAGVAAFALASLGGPSAALVLAGPASAATVAPTISTDEYDTSPDPTCSLREAVQSVNGNMDFGGCAATDLPYSMIGTDTITLGDGTYNLTIPIGAPLNASGDLNIPSGSNVTISHGGSAPAAIDGGDVDNVIHNQGTLSISGITIQNGMGAGVGGGGIHNDAGLTLANVTITDNSAVSEAPGGGLYNNAGSMTLTNVTVSGNRAEGGGGGIFATGTVSTTLTNVTVTNNQADSDADGGDGGGIRSTSSVPPSLKNTILAGNSDNSAGFVPDCNGTMASGDYNLIGDGMGCTFAPPGANDQVGVAAGIDSLEDNGGPSFTHALLPASMATDQVPPASCSPLTTDQRGYPRPFPTGGNCDIGAYELFVCPDGSALNQPGAFPGESGCPAIPPTPPVPMTPIIAPVTSPPPQAKKKCKKGRKLVKGKCVKKKKKKR